MLSATVTWILWKIIELEGHNLILNQNYILQIKVLCRGQDPLCVFSMLSKWGLTVRTIHILAFNIMVFSFRWKKFVGFRLLVIFFYYIFKGGKLGVSRFKKFRMRKDFTKFSNALEIFFLRKGKVVWKSYSYSIVVWRSVLV